MRLLNVGTYVGTLIYKPEFYDTFLNVVNITNSTKIKKSEFEYIHKLISECYVFPDKTSREFYNIFNSELLYALGIIPDTKILSLDKQSTLEILLSLSKTRTTSTLYSTRRRTSPPT